MNQPLHGRNIRKKTAPGKRAAVLRIMIGAAALCLCLMTGYHYKTGVDAETPGTAEDGHASEETLPDYEKDGIAIEGIDFLQLSAEEIEEAVAGQYPWNLDIVWGTQVYELPNLLAAEVLRQWSEGQLADKKTCVVLPEVLGEAACAKALEAVTAWERPGSKADLTGFDPQNGTFLFGDGETGVSFDKEKLAADIDLAIKEKRFEAAIEAEVTEGQESASGAEEAQMAAENLKEQYKMIGTYTTKTTSNSSRNTNILLASQALNGLVLKPGESFSFNERVGQRTSAKGYKKAAAYSNGEVVQEVGGGVCQVSTTLYNAVVTSGLETISRKSHTFKPTYVTPGMDATVSWGGPDYQFKNNSAHSVGILADFKDQVLTISIYGMPVLEEGVTHSLESKKTADLGVPAPGYVEDGALPPGAQVVRKNGSSGSKWATYLVVTRDGQVISRELDHTASYKGHAGLVAINSKAPVPTAAPVPEQPAETAPSVPEETKMPPRGPGEETQPPTTAGPGAEPSAPTAGEPGVETPAAGQEAGSAPGPVVETGAFGPG